jgi:uncharacterized protein with ParB-like and HNH nuclease domain
MRPFSRSILELFDGKRRYLIPMFQRQYVWREDPQLDRIWEDVKNKVEQRLANRRTFPHFLGAIVISQMPTFGKQVQAYDVIDGQQRLSTFQILLCSFRDIAASLDSEFAAELHKHIVNDGVMQEKETERYKLWPTQVDRPQLMAIVDEGSVALVEAKEKADFNPKKTGVQPNMIGAYRYFYEKISLLLADPTIDGGLEERVEALFSSLKNDLALVSIELEGGDDPQVIFETLNGFGQPLLPTDLMRNYIFQTAYREKRKSEERELVQPIGKSPESLYSEYWLPLDQPFWKKEEKQGRMKRPRVDNFFMHFLAMKKGTDINVGRLFHEYRLWVEEKKPYSDVEHLLKDTSNFSALYRAIVQPEHGSNRESFSKALSVFEVSTIVPLALYLAGEAGLTKDELKICFDMLESFLVRRAICGLTNKAYNRLFIQVIEQIRGSDDVVSALAAALSKPSLDAASAVWPDDALLWESWHTRPIYAEMNAARVQFILNRLEVAMRSAKSDEFTLNAAMTVEHIMPVAWWTNWPLRDGRVAKDSGSRLLDEFGDIPVDEESKARDRSVHTIGNLTLLTQSLNSSVSNGPWDSKKAAIMEHSALAISRGFLDIDQWDEGAITSRSKTLFMHAVTTWGGPNTRAFR